MDVLMARTFVRRCKFRKNMYEASAEENVVRERLWLVTEDEKITMEMIASGKPDKAIAARLDVSLRTVQLRRASLMKKLNVTTWAGIIRLAPSGAQTRVDSV